MRSLIAAIALAVLTSACAAPAPTTAPSAAPVSPESSHAPGSSQAGSTASPIPPPTPRTTEAPLPSPTMTAFSAPYPDTGWAIAAAIDATGAAERSTSYGRVKAGALLDFAFTCERRTRISVQVSDSRAKPGDTLFRFEVPCSPDQVGRATAPSTSAKMSLTLDATVDPDVRFWVKLGVPADHFLP